jgi:hypothetical protein
MKGDAAQPDFRPEPHREGRFSAEEAGCGLKNMNKGITVLLMLVILGAMGMVFFSHLTAENNLPPAGKSDVAGRFSSDDGKTGGGSLHTDLIRIDPPMSSLAPYDVPPREGAPRTVRTTVGATPKPAGGAAETRGPETGARAAAPARREQTGEISGGPPGVRQAAVRPGQTSQEKPPAPNPADRPNDAPAVYAAPLHSTEGRTARHNPGPAGSFPDTGAPTPQSPAPAPGNPVPEATTPPDIRTSSDGPATTVAPDRTNEPVPDTRQPPSAPATQSRPNAEPARSPANTAQKPPNAAAPETRLTASTPARTSAVPAGKETRTLKNISLAFADSDMRLLIEADGAFPCKTFILSGPDRLVIDLPGAWKGMKAPTVPGNRIIRKARVGLQSGGARIVLDLNSPLKNHKVERRGNMVDILVQ